MRSYLAPSYFAEAYFSAVAPLRWTGSATPNDADIYAAIVFKLRQTGRFADVSFPASRSQGLLPVTVRPVAQVTPRSWRELEQPDGETVLRSVTYEITIWVRGRDPSRGFADLATLAALSQDVLDKSDLGGFTVPGLTRLSSGRVESHDDYPDQHATLSGQFAYTFMRSSGRVSSG